VLKLTIVDVFAERRYAGNQLAVVENAGRLDGATMQEVAREMNFSETTFVTERSAARATVRLFTPAAELPFAGHPTLGTAWVLAGGRGTITLDLAAGAVPVTFEREIGWMTPPRAVFRDGPARATAAALVGLPESALEPGFGVRVADIGPTFVLIGVRTLEHLREARLNEGAYATFAEGPAGAHGVFVFAERAYEGSDFGARMFFEAGGVREDPATGSANTAFAAYLTALGRQGEVIVDQGVEMQRPSRLYLRLGESVQVGGKVVRSVSGTLDG
jgi:trans-2,3-dihydro-3-hydroxyanthranilate isomerase